MDYISSLQFSVTPTFIVLFFLVDQIFCITCHFVTRKFKTKEFSYRQDSSQMKDIFKHATWGFVNSKTYHLILLLLMYNNEIKISVFPLLVDAALGITPRLVKVFTKFGFYFEELVYHFHRMAHLPFVYEGAHKMHHNFSIASAFDAHIFGNGMPEEFFGLALLLFY